MNQNDLEALKDSAGLIKEANLNPEDWVLTGYRQWGAEDSKQTYLSVVPKKPEGLVVAARMPGNYKRKAREPQAFKTKPSLSVFISDQHCPYFDEALHAATLDWLSEHQPQQVILGGDILEFDTISRHRSKPQQDAVQQAIDSGYGVLRDYVQATPRASFVMLPGNHDVRLQNFIVDRAAELYGIRKGTLADEDVPEALGLTSLLRLDELGIKFIDGSYENSQVQVTPHLAARHGWKAYRGAGRTAHSTMTELGHSVIVGHTHRQGLSHRTVYSVTGEVSTQVGIEAGAMCELSLAETYSTNADWQQGFVAVTIFPDGSFHPEFATYIKAKLHFRDQVYG